MIVIRESYKLSKDFKNLVEFFNQLENRLEYPGCEGYSDIERELLKAESELIMWGKI